jgi:hypothetical protein
LTLISNIDDLIIDTILEIRELLISISQSEAYEYIEFYNLFYFSEAKPELFSFLETQESGSIPPQPPDTNTPTTYIPYPQPNFIPNLVLRGSMVANRPWITIDALTIAGASNALPKSPKKLFPKFDPNKDVLPEDHIKKFILSLRLMHVQYEDVVCRLFPYTFQGKESTWFFSLALRSITSWKQFEAAFMTQFRDDETLGTLFLELSWIKINKKEKIKEFNKRFTNLLNKIPDKPVEVVKIEFYTVAFSSPIAMFLKRKEKQNLDENLEEDIKAKKDLESISNNLGNEEKYFSTSENNGKNNMGTFKTDSDKKEKEPADMNSMQRMIKQLKNAIIYLKKSKV